MDVVDIASMGQDLSAALNQQTCKVHHNSKSQHLFTVHLQTCNILGLKHLVSSFACYNKDKPHVFHGLTKQKKPAQLRRKTCTYNKPSGGIKGSDGVSNK